jgi:hypothetical protein
MVTADARGVTVKEAMTVLRKLGYKRRPDRRSERRWVNAAGDEQSLPLDPDVVLPPMYFLCFLSATGFAVRAFNRVLHSKKRTVRT